MKQLCVCWNHSFQMNPNSKSDSSELSSSPNELGVQEQFAFLSSVLLSTRILSLSLSLCRFRPVGELSDRSSRSTLLFLVLLECFSSTLLFCLCSLHAAHVRKLVWPGCSEPGKQAAPEASDVLLNCWWDGAVTIRWITTFLLLLFVFLFEGKKTHLSSWT